jgi:fused signal recognition particle receptor
MGIFGFFRKDKNEKSALAENLDKAYKNGLTKSSSILLEGFERILKTKKYVDGEALDDLEELLLTTDISISTTHKIIDSIKNQKLKDIKELKSAIKLKVLDIMRFDSQFDYTVSKPFIIIVVGVNGVGKTTTVGKLAFMLKNLQQEVVLAACDTYRAAAIDQLQVYADRINVHLVKQQHGSDPSAVLFDAAVHCQKKNIDILIVDTAGRIHNKVNLMNELNKIVKTAGKVVPGSPHEVLLVLDSTTGQNALNQAKNFKEVANITGIILTKLDGTAKGGIAVSIVDELKIPVKFVGFGEGIEDLKPFDANIYVNTLFS